MLEWEYECRVLPERDMEEEGVVVVDIMGGIIGVGRDCISEVVLLEAWGGGGAGEGGRGEDGTARLVLSSVDKRRDTEGE